MRIMKRDKIIIFEKFHIISKLSYAFIISIDILKFNPITFQ